MVGPGLVGSTVSDAVIVIDGRIVVGGSVVGATVVGGTVVGGTVVGGTVVGVVSGVGAGVAVGVADLEVAGVAELLVLTAAGVVDVVPGAEVDGFATGPTVVLVVGGLSRALMIGGSPVLPERFVEPPIAFGLPLELPLALAWAAAGDSIGSAVGAGQLAALQAMNPFAEVPDWDAPVPYQQMIVIAPSTPVPITRFRTECGRCKSSSFGCCRYNDFPPACHSCLLLFRGVRFP
ncbi:MAG TPA: hypothetical protein VE441_07675 [Mycobacterium sp.]|nr:hypothetical protein [Mycobacterium sp.]